MTSTVQPPYYYTSSSSSSYVSSEYHPHYASTAPVLSPSSSSSSSFGASMIANRRQQEDERTKKGKQPMESKSEKKERKKREKDQKKRDKETKKLASYSTFPVSPYSSSYSSSSYSSSASSYPPSSYSSSSPYNFEFAPATSSASAITFSPSPTSDYLLPSNAYSSSSSYTASYPSSPWITPSASPTNFDLPPEFFECSLLRLSDELLDTIGAMLERDRDFVSYRETCRRIYLATEAQATQRKAFYFHISLIKNPTDVWLQAVTNGDLALLNFLALNHPDGFCPQVIETALFSNGNFGKKRSSSQEKRELQIMQWFFSTFPDVFSYSLASPSPYSTYQLTQTAASRGDLDLLQRLYRFDRNTTISSEDALNLAAWNGHHRVVKWMVLKNPYLASSQTMSLAVINGHKKVVQVLYTKHSRFRSTACVNHMESLAREHRNTDIANWLKRIKGAEKAAVTSAAVVGTTAGVVALAMCSLQ